MCRPARLTTWWQTMWMSGISKSQVSRLCGESDEKIHSFFNRPLEGDWPYPWLDATYVKVREAGRIVSVAVSIARWPSTTKAVVRCSSWRSVYGRSRPSGPGSCASLIRRRLRGIQLVISDDHKGLKAAVTRILGVTSRNAVACISCPPSSPIPANGADASLPPS